jgi:hypothetical protein
MRFRNVKQKSSKEIKIFGMATAWLMTISTGDSFKCSDKCFGVSESATFQVP